MLVDFTKQIGKIKIMHAVNNGPLQKTEDQKKDNYDSYKALEIPFARNHDASFNWSYGGSHSTDVHYIFQDFDAPVDDPKSYDFVLTDQYIQNTLNAGTETFYRLGSKIEHEIKKYGTLPPKDNQKYAEICEHIIRHMNYGWSEGHEFGITYWEIWNEPDLGYQSKDPINKKCWGGTVEEFYDFYEIVAKHLKKTFPELKIGGPAVCVPGDWLESFLTEMKKRSVPIDFISWHTYTTDPNNVTKLSETARDMFVRCGYGDVESILDEWNYVEGWSDEFVPSIETIINHRGAAFTAACMINGQNAPVDMMMYYDARPCVFNGLWDFYTCKNLHGYYPFLMYRNLYSMGTQINITDIDDDIYALGTIGPNGKKGLMISVFSPDKNKKISSEIEINLRGISASVAHMMITNKDNKCLENDIPVTNGKVTLKAEENTVIYLEIEN